MNITLTGIDLSKEVFEVRSENHNGGLVRRGMVYRKKLRKVISQLPKGSTIAMEACASAHYWGREFEALGFKVLLIPPQFVTPFRKSQKNDTNDAEAICEAARRPSMRFVPVKSEDDLDMQMLHGVREQFKKQQTALINQLRAILYEHGIVIAKSVSQFRKKVPLLLEEEGGSSRFKYLIRTLWNEFCQLEETLKNLTKEVSKHARTNEKCKLILKLEGIGAISASALVAMKGDVSSYKNGRNYSSSLGMVPKQFTTGGKVRLGRITKCGSSYLRQLLIHGARSVVKVAVKKKKTDHLSLWIRKLHAQKGTNRTAVALANKNARRVWAILSGKTPHEERLLLAA